MSSLETFHPDNEFIKSEKAEYKKWEEVRGELVGGDTPDKKLEWDKDKNKEDTDRSKISYAHKPNEQEMQRSLNEKEEALRLVNWSDDSTWPPITIDTASSAAKSKIGWTEWWRGAEAQLV
jgi:hypothetical protein